MAAATRDGESAQSEIWKRIDHFLVRLKLSQTLEEMDRIEQQHLASLRLMNEGYETKLGGLVGKMEAIALRTDEELNQLFRAYCEVWTTQGHQKSAAFVRAVHQNAIIPHIEMRCSSAFAGFTPFFRKLLQRLYGDRMRRLALRWKRKLEIEAREYEHRERIANRTSNTRSDKHPSGQNHGARLAKPLDVEQVVSVQREPSFMANKDYRSIRFNGQAHTLTPKQATIIKILHEASQRKNPSVGKAELLAAVETETSRLPDIFRGSPLWQTLVVQGERRGTYRLNLTTHK
jgi:hypothetical protein